MGVLRTAASWDALAGLAAFSVTYWLALNDAVAQQAASVAFATTALGVAAVAVVLTVMAILVAFLSDEYLSVVHAAGQSIDEVLLPYKSVVVASAVCTIVSLMTAVAAPALTAGGWLLALGLAASVGSAIWALVGTVQLVGVTATHVKNRTTLLAALATARRIRDERRHKPSA